MTEKPIGYDRWNKDRQWGYLRGLANGRVQGKKEVLQRLLEEMPENIDEHISGQQAVYGYNQYRQQILDKIKGMME